jgi:type VI secretion system Hcp family effector
MSLEKHGNKEAQMFKPSTVNRGKCGPLLLLFITLVAVASSVAMLSPGRTSAQTGGDVASSSCLSCFAYIKFDGIEGEALQGDHVGWSHIQTFNQSILRANPAPVASSRRSAGAAVFEEIVVVKEIDASTPKLAEATAKGAVFGTVDIQLTRPSSDGSQQTYYTYELKNVIITSYSIGSTGMDDVTPSGLPLVAAGGPSDLPMEQLSLNFEEIKVIYTKTDSAGSAGGKVEYTWKVEEGKK